MSAIERAWNWLRGYRFYWQNGTMECSPGTCPYPVRCDWSVKACIKAGYCGCDEKDKR